MKEMLQSVKHLDFPVVIYRFLFHFKGIDLLGGSISLDNKLLVKAAVTSFPRKIQKQKNSKQASKR